MPLAAQTAKFVMTKKLSDAANVSTAPRVIRGLLSTWLLTYAVVA